MNKRLRLSRLEAVRAAAGRASSPPILMRWETPDGPVERGPRNALLTIHLTGTQPPNHAPERLDADPTPEPKPIRPRGQRPAPPTEEQLRAAEAELARRWAEGRWVGSPEMVPAEAVSHLRAHVAPRLRTARSVGFDPFKLR